MTRPVLKLVQPAPGACPGCARLAQDLAEMEKDRNGIYGKMKAFEERMKKLRGQLAEMSGTLAKAVAGLGAYRKAFDVIASAQELKRRDAGLESANEVLRLAADVPDADAFERWLAEIRRLVALAGNCAQRG